jgi:hypothetical protein
VIAGGTQLSGASFKIIVAIVLLLLFAPVTARATEALTDDQLDQISAGDFSFNIGEDANGLPTVNFGFLTGGTSGNGQIVIQPSNGLSSAINTGNVSFSNTLFHVDNMIFNMNICVQCHATTLTQGNLGVPITFKMVP